MARRVYLDSNIIISAFSGEGERENAVLLLDLIGAVPPTTTDAPFVTSELTLAETLVRPLRIGLDEMIRTMDTVLTSSAWLSVVPIDRQIMFGAAWARSLHRSVKLPDAIHIATAIASRCSDLLTADTGLAGEYDLRDWQRGATHRPGPVRVIRPDVSTLQELIAWLSA
ncbi:MAG TPA: PIN domain-containing protein [Devosiaceae bacterium]|nr:PIN domain-containing protein [Devosiaceae bacterium]